MYRIVAPIPFLSSVPGWIVLEAVPSALCCFCFGAASVKFIFQNAYLPPSLVSLLSQPLNLLDGTPDVVNSGGWCIKHDSRQVADACTALLNGCGDLLKTGDGVEVAHGRIVSGLGADVKYQAPPEGIEPS